MSQRLYALITRSSTLLILALLLAPIWDSWRYRGLPPSGGAAFPVGAIMPAPPRPSEAQPSRVVPAATRPAIPADETGGGRFAGLQTALPALAPPPNGTHQPATRLPGSGFEAWTAGAQIDPFWNGDTSPSSPAARGRENASVAEAPDADGPDEIEHPEAGLPDAVATTSGGRPRPGSASDRRHLDAVDAGPEGDAPGQRPAPADDGAQPGQSGMVAGMWPALPAESDTSPKPVPGPIDVGTGGPGRVRSHLAPSDPTPATVAVPLVSALVATAEVAPGDTISVAIRIDDADEMTSLPFHLIFDPTVIEYAGGQAGTALTTHDPVLLASVSPNRPGDLAVGLSLIESAGAFTGTGEVVSLQFRALAPGRSDLSFSRATLRGARSEPLEVHFASGSVTVR